VLFYRASAGGNLEKLATFERAGVPTVARLKDGRLIAAHQHFPENDRENFDQVAVHFSSDEGRTWTAPWTVRLTGRFFAFAPTGRPGGISWGAIAAADSTAATPLVPKNSTNSGVNP
jgi:hypothetical protein